MRKIEFYKRKWLKSTEKCQDLLKLNEQKDKTIEALRKEVSEKRSQNMESNEGNHLLKDEISNYLIK